MGLGGYKEAIKLRKQRVFLGEGSVSTRDLETGSAGLGTKLGEVPPWSRKGTTFPVGSSPAPPQVGWCV